MKKILITGILSLVVLFSFAQSSVVITMTGSGDTIVNTADDYVLANVIGTHDQVTVQAVVTKITGTVTTTYASVSGSIDGTNFVVISDSLTCLQQTTNTKTWTFNNANYTWYKVVFDGGGTQTSSIRGIIMGSSSNSKHAVQNMLGVASVTTSTVTNTGSGYVESRSRSWYNNVSIQAVVTKVSGTAGGTVTLQGSIDGINYVTVPSGSLLASDITNYSTGGSATLTVANQTTNTKVFRIVGAPFQYYRLSYTGSGTMVCTLKGYFLGNRK